MNNVGLFCCRMPLIKYSSATVFMEHAMKTAKRNVLSSLALTSLPLAASVSDPVQERRNRIVVRLEEQKALLSNPNLTRAVTEKGTTKQQKIRSWVRQGPDGGIVFFVRAGFQTIELAKGKSGVAVPSMDKLPGIIDMLIE